MKNFKLKLIAAASTVGLLSAAGVAQAGAYALSADNIQSFNIRSTNVTFTNSIDTSSANAILNGASAGPTGGTGFQDAPIAVAPGSSPVPANNAAFTGNTITPVGMTATNYSYADALIQHAPGGGLPFNAYTIAESHLHDAGTTFGGSTNSSATGFTATFTAGAGATLDFSFLADPLIRTFLQPQTGIFAQGTLNASLSIRCAQTQCGVDSAGNPIFQGQEVFGWAPDGTVSGAAGVTGRIGGMEVADAESLNTQVSNFAPGELDYSSASGLGSYEAFTNQLSAGNYTLTLAMGSQDSTIKAVPEPGSIALIGLGLGGLGFVGRRRQRKG